MEWAESHSGHICSNYRTLFPSGLAPVSLYYCPEGMRGSLVLPRKRILLMEVHRRAPGLDCASGQPAPPGQRSKYGDEAEYN